MCIYVNVYFTQGTAPALAASFPLLRKASVVRAWSGKTGIHKINKQMNEEIIYVIYK